MSRSCLFLFFASITVISAAINDPVKLDTGMISGVAGNSPEVRVYKGIPFAAPPTGELRWRAPQPPAKWDGTRKADTFGPMCMQGAAGAGKGPAKGGGKGGDKGGKAPAPSGRGAQAMSEDCLY